MDTGTHLRAIWHRRWWVLGAALLAGLLVLVVRSSAEPTYRAETTLFLVPGDAPRAGEEAEVDRLTAAYAEFLVDERVLTEAAQLHDRGLTAAEVRRRVEAVSADDGRLVLEATGRTAADAAQLANATADALSAGARADQAEVLRRELAPVDAELAALAAEIDALPGDADVALTRLQERRARLEEARSVRVAYVRARLDVVRRAQAEDAARTPDAPRDALLAFLLVLIVAAEVAAVRAARRQGLEGPDPVGQLEAWTGLPVFRAGGPGPDEVPAALRFAAADDVRGDVLYVAPLDPGPAAHAATAAVLEVVAATRDDALWLDLAAEPGPVEAPRGLAVRRPSVDELAGLGGGARRGRTTVVTADAWESAALVELADALPGTCLLAVDRRKARRPAVEEAQRVLGYAGLPVVAVLLVDAPRRRGRTPSGQEATAAASSRTAA